MSTFGVNEVSWTCISSLTVVVLIAELSLVSMSGRRCDPCSVSWCSLIATRVGPRCCFGIVYEIKDVSCYQTFFGWSRSRSNFYVINVILVFILTLLKVPSLL